MGSNGRNRQQQKIPKLEYHQQDTDRNTTSIPTNPFGGSTTEADEIDDILKFVSSTTEEEANSQLVKPIKQFSVQSDIIDAKLQSICDEAGQAFPDLAAEFTAGDFLVEELLGEPLSNLEYNQPEGQPMPRPEHQMSSPRQSIGSQSKLSSVPLEPSIGHSDSTQFSQQTECGRSNPSNSPQKNFRAMQTNLQNIQKLKLWLKTQISKEGNEDPRNLQIVSVLKTGSSKEIIELAKQVRSAQKQQIKV